MKPVHLGIDLGTTNSTAAAFDGEAITLIRNAQGGPLTPSVVRYDARGKALVGAKARRFLDTDPANTRSEFKRLMGTSHRLEFPAAGLQKRPEELSAELLRSMRADVQEQLGFLPATAVISVPALFELPQTRATAEAARLAGFDRVEMIQEPVASAIAAGWSAETADGKPWLVYDLGGGTFDASLLETTEGLLRVVGHDGDNFLGGRDVDGAIVEWALAALRAEGTTLDVADPRLAAPLRALRHAAEEAKIELSRAREASLSLPGWADRIDIELTLDRPTFVALCQPLVQRSLEVCIRLLTRHGLRPGGLGHVVLVGGPTVMPWLREAVATALQAPIQAGLDPMTLVAQGAALFAATSGLDARTGGAAAPSVGATPSAPPVWVQHPSMTSDSAPFVVGRVQPGDGIQAVRLKRLQPLWVSEVEKIDEDGAFALQAHLQLRSVNLLQVEGQTAAGWVALSGGAVRIVHGLSLQDPPLSRSIGVALAGDEVRVYVERGSPLPMRRSFVHHTVDAIQPGDEAVLSVPIVQGEFHKASLCRLVGQLTVPARALRRPLPIGSPVEVTLELDRGGRLAASARLEDGSLFEHVASLVVPQLEPASLPASLEGLQGRLGAAQAQAAREFDVNEAARLGKIEGLLHEARKGSAAAQGGDLDALERTRRLLLEVDELFAAQEAESAWPKLSEEAKAAMANAVIAVHSHGHAQEKEVLTDLSRRLNGALSARNIREVERIRGQLRALAANAWLRRPNAWAEEFDYTAGRASEMNDLRKANGLIAEGRKAARDRDASALERVTRALWALLPPSAKDRQRSFGSGLR